MDPNQILAGVNSLQNIGQGMVRGAQLRQLGQQSQMGDMKIQEAQRAQEDQQNIKQVFQASVNPDGSVDRQKLLQGLTSKGYGDKAMALGAEWQKQDMEATKQRVDIQKSLASMGKDQLAAVQTMNGMQGRAASWIKTLPPEQQPAAWDQTAKELGQQAVGLGLPDAFSGHVGKYSPQALDQAIQTSMSLDEVFKARDLDFRGQDITLRGQSLDETKRHNRAMENKPTGGGMGGGVSSGGLSPDALDMMADQFRKTGVLPSAGMGAAGTAMRVKIANRAAEMDRAEGTTTDLAESKRSFKTSQEARDYFTKGKGADAFRQQETILHHADAFTQIANALNNGDIQGANRIGNTLGVQFGSDKATNYKIVGQILSAEVGKYLAGTQSTEAERKELAELIPSFSSPQQIKGGLSTLKTLVEGQRQAWTVQRDAALKGQVPAYSNPGQSSPNSNPQTSGKWNAKPATGNPDTSTLGKNPRFKDAVWVGKGAPDGGGWYHKNADGTVTRVE